MERSNYLNKNIVEIHGKIYVYLDLRRNNYDVYHYTNDNILRQNKHVFLA